MKRNAKSIHLSMLTITAIGVTVLAAVAICMSLFAAAYNKSLLQNASVSAEQSVQQTAIAVDRYLEEMQQKLSTVRAELQSTDSLAQIHEKIETYTRLQEDVFAVMLYAQDGTLLASAANRAERKSPVQTDLSFSASLPQHTDEYAISAPHIQTLFQGEYPWVVTVTAAAQHPLFTETIYIAMDFQFSKIAKYIDNIGIGNHGYSYILDADGTIIYHPQQQLLFSGLKTENTDFVADLADGVHRTHDTIYTLRTTDTGNWRVVGLSFIDDLTAERDIQIFRGVCLSFFFCAILALLTLLVFSQIVTKPVRRLVKAMQSFEKSADDFQYTLKTEPVAEIDVLSASFAHMAKKMQQLMEQIRAEEITLRKTELKALQAQINPHFLYNTLDSIQWMCEQGKNADAVEMVGALARLFRISISRGKELIPLKDELRHAESYLIIQSYRYKNQFTYTFQVDADLTDCLCNKITIQPLLENAIYHGIDRMVDEGQITVRVQKDGDRDIRIEIEDNGVGMREEQCRQILEKEHSDSGGIGVKNVNDRLKIYFGEQYGIQIQSELDRGTLVTVRIPQIRKEDSDAHTQ